MLDTLSGNKVIAKAGVRSLMQPADCWLRQTLGILPKEKRQGLVKITCENTLWVQPRQDLLHKARIACHVKYPSGARLVANITILILRCSVQLDTFLFSLSSQNFSIISLKGIYRISFSIRKCSGCFLSKESGFPSINPFSFIICWQPTNFFRRNRLNCVFIRSWKKILISKYKRNIST